MTPLTTKAAEIRAGLVDRLRKPAPKFGLEEFDPTYDLRHEAAALIERQAAELAEARAREHNAHLAVKEERAIADAAREDARVRLAQKPYDQAYARVEPIIADALNEAGTQSLFLTETITNKVLEAAFRHTFDADWKVLESERDELLREKERLGAELAAARAVMRNAWGAVTSDQVVDKQVDKLLRKGIEAADAALSARPALENGPAGLADADSKSPSPSSQSERIAVLEAVARDLVSSLNIRGKMISVDHDELFALERRARSAIAPFGEE